MSTLREALFYALTVLLAALVSALLIFAGITPVRAAPRHSASVQTTQEKTTPVWTVTAVNNGITHHHCTASRMLGNVQFYVSMNPKGEVVIEITGVKFGDVGTDPFEKGLIAVDDGTPLSVPVRRLTSWTTQFEVHASGDQLTKALAKGDALKLLAGDRIYSVPLVGSSRALRDVQDCNARGQERLDKKRMSDAKPAELRVS